MCFSAAVEILNHAILRCGSVRLIVSDCDGAILADTTQTYCEFQFGFSNALLFEDFFSSEPSHLREGFASVDIFENAFLEFSQVRNVDDEGAFLRVEFAVSDKLAFRLIQELHLWAGGE